MMLPAVFALGVSAVVVVFLCIGDPKRRRSSGASGKVQSRMQRWCLTGVLCLPGIAFALSGDAAAFMMWLGGTAFIGWIIAQILPWIKPAD
ncbi:hypothetical protein TZ53_06195 [Sphingobium sp. YBL2]|nr:hypothetical protein TZ53_06195 [Sphingobium sp. YBL2]